MSSQDHLLECLVENWQYYSTRKKSNRKKHPVNPTGVQIMDWFVHLNPLERVSICAVIDREWICEIMMLRRSMEKTLFRHLRNGVPEYLVDYETSRSATATKSSLVSTKSTLRIHRRTIHTQKSQDGDLYGMKMHYDTQNVKQIQVQEQFLQGLRLFNGQVCAADTLAPSVSLCHDGHGFLKILQLISGHQFLTQDPLDQEEEIGRDSAVATTRKGGHKGERGSKRAQMNKWAKKKCYLNLAEIIVDRIELMIWKRWREKSLQQVVSSIGISSKQYLIEAWEKTEKCQKQQIQHQIAADAGKYFQQTSDTNSSYTTTLQALISMLEILRFDKDGISLEGIARSSIDGKCHSNDKSKQKKNGMHYHLESCFSSSLDEASSTPHFARMKLFIAEKFQSECAELLGNLLVVANTSSDRSLENSALHNQFGIASVALTTTNNARKRRRKLQKKKRKIDMEYLKQIQALRRQVMSELVEKVKRKNIEPKRCVENILHGVIDAAVMNKSSDQQQQKSTKKKSKKKEKKKGKKVKKGVSSTGSEITVMKTLTAAVPLSSSSSFVSSPPLSSSPSTTAVAAMTTTSDGPNFTLHHQFPMNISKDLWSQSSLFQTKSSNHFSSYEMANPHPRNIPATNGCSNNYFEEFDSNSFSNWILPDFQARMDRPRAESTWTYKNWNSVTSEDQLEDPAKANDHPEHNYPSAESLSDGDCGRDHEDHYSSFDVATPGLHLDQIFPEEENHTIVNDSYSSDTSIISYHSGEEEIDEESTNTSWSTPPTKPSSYYSHDENIIDDSHHQNRRKRERGQAHSHSSHFRRCSDQKNRKQHLRSSSHGSENRQPFAHNNSSKHPRKSDRQPYDRNDSDPRSPESTVSSPGPGNTNLSSRSMTNTLIEVERSLEETKHHQYTDSPNQMNAFCQSKFQALEMKCAWLEKQVLELNRTVEKLKLVPPSISPAAVPPLPQHHPVANASEYLYYHQTQPTIPLAQQPQQQQSLPSQPGSPGSAGQPTRVPPQYQQRSSAVPAGDTSTESFVSVPMTLLPLKTKLHWDICEFVSKVQETSQNDLPYQMLAQQYCEAAVHALWPRAQVHPYGSFVTGLALPSSDVDIVLYLPNVHRDTLAETPGDLEGRNAIKQTWQQHLARKLQSEPWVASESVKTIAHAPIPIITLTTIPLTIPCSVTSGNAAKSTLDVDNDDSITNASTATTGVSVRLDVSFHGPGHNGILANDFVLQAIHEFPTLTPLVLVLKTFLIDKGFGAAYTGGLSSYALILLVIRFLQQHESNVPAVAAAALDIDLGKLLLQFLDFYGNQFNPRSTGISVLNRCFFNREQNSGSPAVYVAPQHLDLNSSYSQGYGGEHCSENMNHHMDTYAHNNAAAATMYGSETNLASPGSHRRRFHPSIEFPVIAATITTSLETVLSTSTCSDSGEANRHNRSSSRKPTTGPPSIQQHLSSSTAPQDYHKFDPIFIEDPLRIANNVGRNCFRITQIRRAFTSALQCLTTTPASMISSSNSANLPYIGGVLLNPNNILQHIISGTTAHPNRNASTAFEGNKSTKHSYGYRPNASMVEKTATIPEHYATPGAGLRPRAPPSDKRRPLFRSSSSCKTKWSPALSSSGAVTNVETMALSYNTSTYNRPPPRGHHKSLRVTSRSMSFADVVMYQESPSVTTGRNKNSSNVMIRNVGDLVDSAAHRKARNIRRRDEEQLDKERKSNDPMRLNKF